MTRKIQAQIGCIRIGEGCPIAVQTMCNTHTFNVEDTVAQCRAMAAAGADIIRITVPGLRDVPHMKSIREILRSEGIMTPLVADIHFSSETAIAVAPLCGESAHQSRKFPQGLRRGLKTALKTARCMPGKRHCHPDWPQSRLSRRQNNQSLRQYPSGNGRGCYGVDKSL